MRRGISLGGALDGDGPSRLEERHVDAIRDAGFDTLRLPVRWPRTFDEVDEAIDAALRRDLDVIVDVHQFDGPDLGVLWTRIAEHYANWSPRLHFELLNEPHAPMTAEGWNGLLAETLAVVRASNPDRPVIAGPVKWNTVDALPSLRLPDDDHLILRSARRRRREWRARRHPASRMRSRPPDRDETSRRTAARASTICSASARSNRMPTRPAFAPYRRSMTSAQRLTH